MDFNKLKEFKLKNKSELGPDSTFTIRSIGFFPYSEENERLTGTRYENVIPMGLLSADFLLEESEKPNPRDVVKVFKDYLGEEYPRHIANMLTFKQSWMEQPLLKEETLFSMFLFNEFLAQDIHSSYGEFIEKEGNNVYDKNFMKFSFTRTEFTNEVFQHFDLEPVGGAFARSDPNYQSIFTVTKRTAKEEMMMFKTVTKDEALSILKKYKKVAKANASSRIVVLEGILIEIRSNNEKTVPVSEISKKGRQIAKFWFKDHKVEQKKAALVNYSISAMLKRTKSRAIDLTASSIFSTDLYEILNTFDKYKECFEFEEYVALIKAMSNPKWFSRSGTINQFIKILKEFSHSQDKTLFVNFVKMIADTIYHVDSTLPTMKQWENEAPNILGTEIPASLFVSMILNKESQPRYITVSIESFRNRIKDC